MHETILHNKILNNKIKSIDKDKLIMSYPVSVICSRCNICKAFWFTFNPYERRCKEGIKYKVLLYSFLSKSSDLK